MSREFCPNENSGCKYFNTPSGCYSDVDHIVPQRYRRLGWVIDRYIDTPENKQQLCRSEHDEKNANSAITESPELIPPHEEMASPILQAHERGDIRLNHAQLTYLKGLWEQNGE